MERPKYPVGIQTFSEIINNDYVYVDKTEYVYRLATRGKYYFLSRPRRFGKSLLISTFDSFFRGKRDLFKRLWIEDKKWDWVEYPVFHLALNGQNYDSVEKLDETLHNFMDKWESEYGLPAGNHSMSVAVRFANTIYNVFHTTGRQVAILIDEYDQPMLQNVEEGKEELHSMLRQELQGFYSVMKVQDQYIKFGMLTGISKFNKVSVFSGLNNLRDISFNVDTNAICGVCESELTRYFQQGIEDLADMTHMTVEETKEKLRKEFDGYHFADEGEGIYNPFSLLNTFENGRFWHYWFESGTPSFLINILKSRQWDLSKIGKTECSAHALRGSDVYLSNPIPLLYQSGYLTIKGYDPEFQEFFLDYPNEEVSEGFANDLLNAYSCKKDTDAFIREFIKCVERGKANEFMESLRSLFADIPYDQIPDRELHYENMMYLVMKLMGFYTHTEYRTSDGRIDMVVMTDRYVYVMEFKLNGTPEEAMAQIREKEYTIPFLNDGRKIILIGANFSNTTRRLDRWIIENL